MPSRSRIRSARWAADESEAEQQRRWAEGMAGPRASGFSMTFVDDVQAAQQAAAVARAREVEHLGRWRLLVAHLEPMRDALLDRIRAELGDAFHVPTPLRVP